MVQAWDPLHPVNGSAWNFVCWTLSVEIFFYLVFPWVQRFYERTRLHFLLACGGIVLLIGVFCNTPFHNDELRYSGFWFYAPAPVIHLPEFFSGVLGGNLFHRYRAALKKRSEIGGKGKDPAAAIFSDETRFPWITITGLLASILILILASNNWEGLEIPFFCLFLFGLASEASWLSRFLSWRILVVGGEISYAMYLLRTPLASWIHDIPPGFASNLLLALYIPCLLIPFSWLTFYCIETPARKFLRRSFSVLNDRLARFHLHPQ